jgi:cAMP phosphodiesterase
VQYLTTLIVDDAVALDAGSLGFWGSCCDQQRVQHVFLTHAHLDHIASLPIFLENVADDRPTCPTVYAMPDLIDVLRTDVFNDRLFPDFEKISRSGPPLVHYRPLAAGRAVTAAGLVVTPVPVDHIVPTVAYVVEGPTSAFAFVTDTAPTEAVWALANRTPNLKAVFLEVTFPESHAWLAQVSKHLTPSLFAAEVAKLRPGVAVYAIHVKARFREAVLAELAALELPNVTVLEAGRAVVV